MKPKEVVEFAREKGVKVVDFRFVDLPGVWQHFSISVSELAEDIFEDGLGFDGSSIRGFQQIQESDMLLIPDAETAFLDPFTEVPTLDLICNVRDPVTGESYTRDPRYIAQKAEKHLAATGLADTVYVGPEPEFFVLDDVRYDTGPGFAYYHVDSVEASWNTGRDENPNLGHKPRYKEGYFPVPPVDTLQDMRTEMMLTLESIGIRVEVHHHEVATAGQNEIDMHFDTLTRMADKLQMYKYVVKNVAKRRGKTATFMPKPIFSDNGSGMHVHQSLWKKGKNIFYAPGNYADISQDCQYYIGGLLKHSPALLALVAPTVNSYRRLVPGFEAPVTLIYSQRNRSAMVRIPAYSKSEGAKRLEYRVPDPSCNGYLAFAAMLMAGLDGIENKIMPPDPIDKDLYDLAPEEQAGLSSTPGSLGEVLDALEADHDWLLKGDVFTQDVVDTWLAYKREHEVDPLRLRPHPYEFTLYYDI